MGEKSLEIRRKDLSERYGIDFEKLEKEQIDLAKGLVIADKIDFTLADRIGAIENIFIRNKILSCIIVLNKNFEIIDQAYILDRISFPYFPGFRNYRELPAMIKALDKLSERPDLVLISAQGLIHPRLGLASHFGLSTGIPTIGVSPSIVDCKYEEKDGAEITRDNKTVGKVLISKAESNPLFVSPGDNITIDTSYNLSKELIKHPHKRPEPIHIVAKYAKKVRKELMIQD